LCQELSTAAFLNHSRGKADHCLFSYLYEPVTKVAVLLVGVQVFFV